MRWLLLIAALIEVISTRTYAHGEQVAYVFFSDALVIAGWTIFLFIYKAPVFHKIAIFATVLLVILLSWLLISTWYITAIEHPLVLSAGFVLFHTIVGILIIFFLRKLTRSEDRRSL